jgi:hypothetical protein
MLEMLSQAGVVALLSLVVAVLPLGAGIAYAVSPTEQRLALMRPISLAAIFGASSGLLSGGINLLQGIAIGRAPVSSTAVAVGLAEALVPLFVGFGALTIAWLCVAVGLRRHS